MKVDRQNRNLTLYRQSDHTVEVTDEDSGDDSNRKKLVTIRCDTEENVDKIFRKLKGIFTQIPLLTLRDLDHSNESSSEEFFSCDDEEFDNTFHAEEKHTETPLVPDTKKLIHLLSQKKKITFIGVYEDKDFDVHFNRNQVYGSLTNLNEGTAGSHLYLFWEFVPYHSPVKELKLVYGKEAQAPATDSEVGATWIKIAIDLNKGAKGKYIHLCYRVGGGGKAITDIIVFAAKHKCKSDEYLGFKVLRSETKGNGDLSEGTIGRHVYIGYKQ